MSPFANFVLFAPGNLRLAQGMTWCSLMTQNLSTWCLKHIYTYHIYTHLYIYTYADIVAFDETLISCCIYASKSRVYRILCCKIFIQPRIVNNSLWLK